MNKQTFILILLASLAITLMESCRKTGCVREKYEGACTMDYNPVCGCNGITYSNACAASWEGIYDYSPGTCSN